MSLEKSVILEIFSLKKIGNNQMKFRENDIILFNELEKSIELLVFSK